MFFFFLFRLLFCKHLKVICLRVISNRTRAARSFDFEITRMISDQIALHSVQLPLYYIHFEIAKFDSLDTRTTRTTKVAKFAKQWPFYLSFSCNVIV